MKATTPRVKLTYDDFVLFPDDGKRHELIDGEHYVTPKHVRGAPELVVEIGFLSTRKRDETIKRRLYERTGVSEYWVIDPELDVVRVYRRAGSGFGRPIELSAEAGDRLETELLPGLEIALSRLFEPSVR